MAATARHAAAARINGRRGGRPTNAIQEMKRKARERAARLLCSETEESILFLKYVRDNPNVPWGERVRCALEMLNRGEVPSKTSSYLGTATPAGELMDEPPKLVVLGKFGAEKVKGDPEGNGSAPHTNGHEGGAA